MRDFLYGREDDEIYQYCPEGENNVLITSNGSDVLIASQNPDGNTAIEDQMLYQCVAYCTGGSGDPSESGNLGPFQTHRCPNHSELTFITSKILIELVLGTFTTLQFRMKS